MIRFAADEDHAVLKSLWKQIFGDSIEVIDYYFSHRHQNQNMLVYEAEGTIIGMLTMLPVEISIGQENYSGRYIYAVATEQRHRGQGVSTKLLLYCHDFMRKNKETAAVLAPASDGLFTFYQKRGYETVFFVETQALSAKDLPVMQDDAACISCSAQNFYRIRNTVFADSILFVRWGIDALEYVIGGAKAFGDDVYYIRTNKGEGIALCGRRGNTIFIRELDLIGIDIPDAIAVLHGTLNANEYSILLPEGSLSQSRSLPYGMIHYLEDAPRAVAGSSTGGKPPYLSL